MQLLLLLLLSLSHVTGRAFHALTTVALLVVLLILSSSFYVSNSYLAYNF